MEIVLSGVDGPGIITLLVLNEAIEETIPPTEDLNVEIVLYPNPTSDIVFIGNLTLKQQ